MADARGDEHELARLARNGCRRAFTDLVQRHEVRVYRFLLMRTAHRQDAEELTQETFLRAWHRRSSFVVGRPYAPWLLAIAAHLATDRQRRRAPPETVADDPACPRPNPAAAAEASEQSDNLWELARHVLGAEARTALWLRYGEEMTATEIGTLLGKREDAVRAMLHRARARLARCLAEAPRAPAPAPAIARGRAREAATPTEDVTAEDLSHDR